MEKREEVTDNGTEEFNYFLSVLFPDDQLMIMDYNRVVRDLNGLSTEAFLEETGKVFKVTKLGETAKHPVHKGQGKRGKCSV